MSDPNSALSVWQLTLLAVVPFVLLVGWLIAVFIAAREPRMRNVVAAAGPAVAPVQAPVGQDEAARPEAAGQDEPARPNRRLAA